jgi:hypothetical protein
MRNDAPYSIPYTHIFYVKILELRNRYFEPMQNWMSLKIQLKSEIALFCARRTNVLSPLAAAGRRSHE